MINPDEFNTVESFKSAYYDKHGVGTWIDDLKLDTIWRKAHDKTLKDYHKAILKSENEGNGEGEGDGD